MKRVAAIVGAILIGLLTVWGYANDGYDLLPENKKRPLRNCMVTPVGCAKDVWHKSVRFIGHNATKAQQILGRQRLGAAAATSSTRKYMPRLYRKQNGKDALCGNLLPNLYVGVPWLTRKLNPKIEVDHIWPKSLGGTDNIGNLQLTRDEYNRAKSNKTGFALKQALPAICRI